MNFKNIAIFAVGAALGSGITYKLVKDKYELLAQQEIDEVRELYRTKTKAYKNTNTEDEKTETTEDDIMEDNKDKKKILYRKPDTKYYDYTKCHPTDDDEEIDFQDYNKEDYDNDGVKKRPHIITTEQFDNERRDFDKLSLTYYFKDETLVDEHEEIIDDIDGVIGSENLVCFGDGSDDEDIVYIRNYNLGIDYEVTRVNQSFKEMTGMGDY